MLTTALSLNAVEKTITLRIGLFENKPVIYRSDNNEPRGVYVEFLQEIAKHENWKLIYVYDTFANHLQSMKTHKIDIMTSVGYSKERDTYMDFSKENVLTVWGKVYVKKGNKLILNILDLRGKKIAVLNNGINGLNLMKLARELNVKCEFVSINSHPQIAQSIVNEDVDAGVMNSAGGDIIEEKYKIQHAHVMFSPYNLLFSAPNGKHGEILSTIDKYLAAWKKDKNSIYNKNKLVNQTFAKDIFVEVVPFWIYYVLGLSFTTLFFLFLLLLIQSKLKDSEKKLNETAAIASVGGWELELASSKLSWTDEVYRIHELDLNYKPLLEKAIDFYHPDSIDDISHAVNRCINEGEPFDLQAKLITAKGNVLWVNARGKARYKKNKIVKISGTFQNINDRKVIEIALSESEEKYRLLFEIEKDAIFIFNRENFEVYDVNQAATDLYGYTYNEFMKLHPYDLTFEKNATKYAIENEIGIVPERRHRKKDGSEVSVEIRNHPFELQGQKLMMTTMRDITERKRTEGLIRIQRDVAQVISSLTTFEDTFLQSLEVAIDATSFDSGGMYLLDDESGDFQLICSEGLSPSFVEYVSKFEKDSPNAGLIIKGEVISVKYSKLEIPLAEVELNEGLKYLVIFPIFQNDRVIGCMNIASHIIDNVSSPEMDVLRSIAHQIGQGINRLRSEKSLADSEKRFRSLIDYSPIGIIMINDYEIVYINDALADIFGYDSQQELIGTSFIGLIALEDREIVQKNYDARRKGENAPENYESKGLRKNGEIFYLDVSASVLEIEGKQLVIGFLSDITLRKEAENIVRNSEEKFRELAEQLPELVFELDLNCNFIYINTYGLETILYGSKDIENKLNCIDLIVSDQRQRAYNNFKLILDEQSISNNEYTIIRKDGSTFQGIIRSNRIMKNNELIGMRGVISDISEIREVESKLRQSIEDKELLIRETYHRVKNNLNVVQSLFALQKNEIDDKEMSNHFNDAINRVNSMSMIHEMLHNSDDMKYLSAKEYVIKLVESLLFNNKSESQNILFKKDVEDITMDVSILIPLGLIINELLSNALKYAFIDEADGELTISLKKNNEDLNELIIKDSGSGLPEDFDIKKSKSLGLKIVNLLVRQIRGTIDISKRDGAEFTIIFNENISD